MPNLSRLTAQDLTERPISSNGTSFCRFAFCSASFCCCPARAASDSYAPFRLNCLLPSGRTRSLYSYSGLDNGGWTPPFIHVNELIAADLSTVISRGNSPFEPCKPYVDRFYAIGSEFGIPPIRSFFFSLQFPISLLHLLTRSSLFF